MRVILKGALLSILISGAAGLSGCATAKCQEEIVCQDNTLQGIHLPSFAPRIPAQIYQYYGNQYYYPGSSYTSYPSSYPYSYYYPSSYYSYPSSYYSSYYPTYYPRSYYYPSYYSSSSWTSALLPLATFGLGYLLGDDDDDDRRRYYRRHRDWDDDNWRRSSRGYYGGRNWGYGGGRGYRGWRR